MEKGLIDLHTHTCFSDGELMPEELIELAEKIGITTLAITDHNTIDGLKTIDIEKHSIKIIPGIELSAKTQYHKMHILGYDFNPEDRILNNELNKIKETKIDKILYLIYKLKTDYNIDFKAEDVNKLINSIGSIGRPHVAHLLVKYGIVENPQEAFIKYFKPTYADVQAKAKTISYPECLDLITKAGGLPVLAHPNSLRISDNELEKLIIRMKSQGLAGIETFHSSHSAKEREFYHYLAEKHKLLETAGSDFHGPNLKPNINLGSGTNGNLLVKDISILNKIKKRT